MANKIASPTNNKLVLMNDQLFVGVYTAGTNVKKFTQQADRNNKTTNILEVCKFVLRLVESRTLPLEVCAKIVCGMGRIRLYHLQKLFAEFTVLSHRSSLDRRIGYGEKNVVRQMKVQVECQTKGKTSGSSKVVTPDFDLGVVNFDLDIKEQFTEKEVIFSLVSCKNATTVKNVQDITLRDEPRSANYSTLQYDQEEDDFGAASSNEMLDFFSSHDDQRDDDERVDSVSIDGSAAILPEMDIDLPEEPELDTPNDTRESPTPILPPLIGTIEPVPIANEPPSIVEKDDQMLLPVPAGHDEGSIPGFWNDDAASNISLPEETNAQPERAIVKSTGRKRRLIIDAHTQINFNCLKQRILNWPKHLAKLQRPNPKEELDAILAEAQLQKMFTKPIRPWKFSFMFELPEPTKSVKRKASYAEFDLCSTKRPNSKRTTTATSVVAPMETINDEPYITANEPPIPSTTGEPQPITAGEHVEEPVMKNFLTSFTGNPSQWDFLKSCEPTASEPEKQQKHDEGAVTRYAAVKVLESMFDSVPDNSVQFELLQSKMSNRLIAASLFGKLLDLSKDKTIMVSTDERGTPVRVHKYMNWKGA